MRTKIVNLSIEDGIIRGGGDRLVREWRGREERSAEDRDSDRPAATPAIANGEVRAKAWIFIRAVCVGHPDGLHFAVAREPDLTVAIRTFGKLS
jgi:hypothetical protein